MGRVAVITGGTRGIGAAVSKALKAAGYRSQRPTTPMTKRHKNLRPRPASMSTNGTSRSTKTARPVSRGSQRTLARSMSWSTMPASPRTACFTR